MRKPDLIRQPPIERIKMQQYERYLPTAFDESLSLLEKVNKVIWKLNELGELTNEMLERWNEVIEWILGDGLKEVVIDQLQRWKEDGTLADIINEEIFAELNEKIEAVKQQVEQLIADMEQWKKDFEDEMENYKEATKNEINSLMQKSNGAVYQKKQMYADMGMDSDAIFAGAERANQGMAYVKHNGIEKIFMISRVEGSSWESVERQRITEFEFKDNGSYVKPTAWSDVLSLSHQGISAYVENGEIVLITGANTGDGANQAKGYSKVFWKGNGTSQSNVVAYQLFGETNSNHPLHYFNHGTPCVTPDGKYIVIATSATFQGGLRYCFIYDREQVENASNSLDVEPLNSFKINPPPYVWGNVVQDIVCDGTFVYIATGNPSPKEANMVTVHNVSGIYEGYYRIDGSIGDYTVNELKGNTSKGIPKQLEPEGLSIRGNNLLFETTDVWVDSSDNYLKRDKVIHEISRNPEGGKPINRGWQQFEAPSTIHLHGNSNDITVARGDAMQFSDFDPETYEMREMFGYHSQHGFYVYDVRDGADEGKHVTIMPYYKDNQQYTIFRSDRSNAEGAGFTANLHNSKNPSGTFTINASNGTNDPYKVSLFGDDYSALAPSSNHTIHLGSPSNKWETVYANDGTISTSDENYKQDIVDIHDKVLDAWQEVDYKQFRFKEAVQKKGENARTHIGIIAQDIIRAFEKHGLNAFDYGLVGYDKWEETKEVKTDEGEIIVNYKPAGERYSIRADECQFLEMAVMRRELEKLR